MPDIIIFNKLKWKPPITTKLLSAPEAELNLSFSSDAISKLPKDQRALFDKHFKSLFDARFNALSQAKIKQIQDAVTVTEQTIAAKKTDAERTEAVNTSNQLLKQAIETWQGEAAKACEESAQKAYSEMCRALKIKEAKIALKAVGHFLYVVLKLLITHRVD